MLKQNLYTSSFKQFLFRILLPLILLLAGAGIIINYLFEQKVILKSQNCGAYKVNRILNETYPNEIPIFGSSRAEGGIIPDSLDNNCFNYGMSGTRYDVTLFFLEQECKKTKNAPWIILNLDLDGLNDGLGDIGNYIPNSNSPAIKTLLGNEYKFYFSLPFLKYYGRFESYFRTYLNQRIEFTKVTNKGASIERNILPQKEFSDLVAQRKNTITTFICDPGLKNKLLDIITKNRNRQFVFVISPYHSSFFVKYSNPDDAEKFIALLKSFNNVKVFDFSKMNLPDDMFLNTSHVNFKGAAIFNHYLKDSLLSIGVHS